MCIRDRSISNRPPVIVDVVVIAFVVLIVPKPDAIEPPVKASVEVKEEFKMPAPSVVLFNTETLFILKTFPVTRLKFSLDVQFSPVLAH